MLDQRDDKVDHSVEVVPVDDSVMDVSVARRHDEIDRWRAAPAIMTLFKDWPNGVPFDAIRIAQSNRKIAAINIVGSDHAMDSLKLACSKDS